jgi:hypothetical protein
MDYGTMHFGGSLPAFQDNLLLPSSALKNLISTATKTS